MVRSSFRDDGGIRWWEMEDFTVQNLLEGVEGCRKYSGTF